jgi:hypothetical protein
MNPHGHRGDVLFHPACEAHPSSARREIARAAHVGGYVPGEQSAALEDDADLPPQFPQVQFGNVLVVVEDASRLR